jgi:hypothetical protein
MTVQRARGLLRLGMNETERRFVMIGHWLNVPWYGSRADGQVLAYSDDCSQVLVRMFGTTIEQWFAVSETQPEKPPVARFQPEDLSELLKLQARHMALFDQVYELETGSQLYLAIEQRRDAIKLRMGRILRGYGPGAASLVLYAGGAR